VARYKEFPERRYCVKYNCRDAQRKRRYGRGQQPKLRGTDRSEAYLMKMEKDERRLKG